jgi:hypothetical protein
MVEHNSPKISLSDWLSYYQILGEDVKFAKLQQWRLAYYILLIQGAIIAIHTQLTGKIAATIMLFIITFFVSAVGTRYLYRFHDDLKGYRENMFKVIKKIPDELIKTADLKPLEEVDKQYKIFLGFIVSIIWTGFVFVGWILGIWNQIL